MIRPGFSLVVFDPACVSKEVVDAFYPTWVRGSAWFDQSNRMVQLELHTPCATHIFTLSAPTVQDCVECFIIISFMCFPLLFFPLIFLVRPFDSPPFLCSSLVYSPLFFMCPPFVLPPFLRFPRFFSALFLCFPRFSFSRFFTFFPCQHGEGSKI